MNIRDVLETQLTHEVKAGSRVSGNANFALFMSLFTQPGPSLRNAEDTLSVHEPHAVTRPIQFSGGIGANPTANLALLKALSQEPLAQGNIAAYDAVAAVDNLISTHA
ncbi:hypothetical protein [Marinomonas fungiae]|uniref:Uncharacterized protein n=1 Tax=Marinomonas fungiae TaxID=1137284 RepID=A0A0K6IPV3_9GAMM|nr:hypothetical protein [Marinomonas fungiae]CUB05126.1 hypothetical protein Ga0061065_10975 [Marinomonas fungiae]